MAGRAAHPEPIAARHAFALVVAMGLAAALIVPRLALPVSFDASHSYLPMARRLLAEGLAFLHRPESLFYAPLAYVYPALLGASEPLVRWANIALYLATLILAFLVARDAHSNRAGLLAA